MHAIGGAIMVQWIMLPMLHYEVPVSNLFAEAVASLGKTLYSNCLQSLREDIKPSVGLLSATHKQFDFTLSISISYA